MHFSSLDEISTKPASTWAKAPVVVILCEDDTEIKSTLEHHAAIGFKTMILALPPGVPAPDDLSEAVQSRTHTLAMPPRNSQFAPLAVNAVADALPAGTWMGYVYNAEYLYFPFSETRTIGEALAFCSEERRAHVLTYVVDLYSAHLHGNGVDREWAHIDKSGYYALDRWKDGQKMDRQMDFYGGLRWRFEEHIPWERRRIDRVGLFRTGLYGGTPAHMYANHTMTVEELNTYACEWHHSLSAAVCSFRAAKALATNPGSRALIETFHWHNSAPFEWRAQQLMDLGLMEPGQWF